MTPWIVLTPDPAGYRDGQNLYRFYAGPNGVDVLGLNAKDPSKWLTLAAKILKKEVTDEEAIVRRLYHGKTPAHWELRGLNVMIGDSRIVNDGWKKISKMPEYAGKFVRFTQDSVPDFTDFLVKYSKEVIVNGVKKVDEISSQVTIKMQKSSDADFKEAFKELSRRTGKTIEELEQKGTHVWHHGPFNPADGSFTMQYIPIDVHKAVGHTGGRAQARALAVALVASSSAWLSGCEIVAPNSLDAAVLNKGLLEKYHAAERDAIALLLVDNPNTFGIKNVTRFLWGGSEYNAAFPESKKAQEARSIAVKKRLADFDATFGGNDPNPFSWIYMNSDDEILKELNCNK